MVPRTRGMSDAAASPAYALFDALLNYESARAERLLAGDGADEQIHVGPGGFTTLHAAAMSFSNARLLPALVRACSREALNAPVRLDQGENSYDALYNFLMDRRASAARSAWSVQGHTPLSLAVSSSSVDTVRQLLWLGADPAAGSGGQNALSALVDSRTYGSAPRHRFNSDLNEVASLLLSHGADCLQWLEREGLRLVDVEDVSLEPACLAHLERKRAAGTLQPGSKAAGLSLLRFAAKRGHMPLLRHACTYLEPFYAAGAAAQAGPGGLPTALQPRYTLTDVLQAALEGHALKATVQALVASRLPFNLSARIGGVPLLSVAARKLPALVPLLHEAGAPVTAEDILCAVDALSVDGLAALLGCGPPPADTSRGVARIVNLGRQGMAWRYFCPIHSLLLSVSKSDLGSESAQRLPLRCLEMLLRAGLHPTVWRNVQPPGFLRLQPQPGRLAVFDPFDYYDPETLPGRFVFLARGGAWSPTTHHHWPDAFKRTVRMLLLAAHRAGQTGRQAQSAAQACGVGSLPNELLLDILERVAMPMWGWLPRAYWW